MTLWQDDHAAFERPRKRSRPRTKDRPDYSGSPDALVASIDRGRYRCLLDDGTAVTATKARILGRRGVIVGDRVKLDGDVSGAAGTLARIVEVSERRTWLRRSADDADTFERPIVANADQLMIVTALADPEPRMGMIDRILVAAYDALAAQLGLADVHYIPISALNGDNLVHASRLTPWYSGATLLATLEALPVGESVSDAPAAFHFPVQNVLRADGSKQDDFRGYQGRIEAGSVRVGDRVRVEPAGQESTVREIIGINGSVATASVGENTTLRLADDIDISRGDTLLAAANPRSGERELHATLCWFDQRPLNPARKYLLKHTTRTVAAKIRRVQHVWDVHTLSNYADRDTLAMNDLGEVSLVLQQPVAATPYAENPATGAFILIDDASHQTVAAGMILA